MKDEIPAGIPYLVKKRTLMDRIRGNTQYSIIYAKNIKAARESFGRVNPNDDLNITRATDRDVEKYG